MGWRQHEAWRLLKTKTWCFRDIFWLFESGSHPAVWNVLNSSSERDYCSPLHFRILFSDPGGIGKGLHAWHSERRESMRTDAKGTPWDIEYTSRLINSLIPNMRSSCWQNGNLDSLGRAAVILYTFCKKKKNELYIEYTSPEPTWN